MNSLFRVARRMQDLGRLLPGRWQLPVRYQVQRLVGGLEPEVALLPRLVPAGTVAVDVGANMGVYTYALAPLAHAVHAIEPQTSCCSTIEAWAARHGSVHVHNIGAGAQPGRLTLYIPEQDGKPLGTRASFVPVDGPHREVHVAVQPLDTLGLEKVGFIKIDAEGYERDVLEGARQLLQRDRPNLLVEIDPVRLPAEQFAATFALLQGLGYVGHYLDRGALVPCEARIQQQRPEKYNFIFIAQDRAEAA